MVLKLTDYLEIQDTPVSDDDNANFIQIGKLPGKGEKVALLYFDLDKAVQDVLDQAKSDGDAKWADIENIAVTDSRVNFRLYPNTSEVADFTPGFPVLYPLRKNFDENTTWESPWALGDGPVPGVDFYDVLASKFRVMRKVPTNPEWIQAITTQFARYVFTETTYRKGNKGFVFKFETLDGSEPSHLLDLDSNEYVDSEFYPFMDICFLPVEPPMKCEEGTLKRYEMNADTYLTKDGLVHGLEEYTYVGNSGWDGPARTLVDFDISEIPDTIELEDPTDAVYLRMWYEGAEMGKPYNDPRQVARTLAAHKINKLWQEKSATAKYRSKNGNSKQSWNQEMMSSTGNADFNAALIDQYTVVEGAEVGDIYLNLTGVFNEWRGDRTSDMGVVIKDDTHESVPGYFLKFASLNNQDPTKRPYLLVCQKKQTCEPEDLPPIELKDPDGCVSKLNVSLNACVAKNGGCEQETTIHDYADMGFHAGVTALWDENHNLITFCSCCVETETAIMEPIEMNCEGVDGKPDYSWEGIPYIKECACQKCEKVAAMRQKRSTPSRTRLLLRSALKSMLRK